MFNHSSHYIAQDENWKISKDHSYIHYCLNKDSFSAYAEAFLAFCGQRAEKRQLVKQTRYLSQLLWDIEKGI